MGGSLRKNRELSNWALPKDITIQIFQLLQPHEVFRCSQVCVIWSRWIVDANLKKCPDPASGMFKSHLTGNSLRTLLVGQPKQFYLGASGSRKLSELSAKFMFQNDYRNPSLPMTISYPDERDLRVDNVRISLLITERNTGNELQQKLNYSLKFFTDENQAFIFYYFRNDNDSFLYIHEVLNEMSIIRERGIIRTVINTEDTSKKRYGKYTYSDGPSNIVYTSTSIHHTPPFKTTPKILVELVNSDDYNKEQNTKSSVPTKKGETLARKYDCRFMTVDLGKIEEVDSCFSELVRLALDSCIWTHTYVDPSKQAT